MILSLIAILISSGLALALKELGKEQERRKQLSMQLSQLRYANIEYDREIGAQAKKAKDLARKLHQVRKGVSKHDISKLLEKKPKRVLVAVNNGTRKLIGLLECASDITCDMQAASAATDNKSEGG